MSMPTSEPGRCAAGGSQVSTWNDTNLRPAVRLTVTPMMSPSNLNSSRMRTQPILGSLTLSSTLYKVELAHPGTVAVDLFTPMLPVGHTAILGLGRSAVKPAVVDEARRNIGVGHAMALSLVFDHKAVDGAPAAQRLQRIQPFAERPCPWLTLWGEHGRCLRGGRRERWAMLVLHTCAKAFC